MLTLQTAVEGRHVPVVAAAAGILAGLAMSIAKYRGWQFSLPYALAVAGLIATPLATLGWGFAAALGQDSRRWRLLFVIGALSAAVPSLAFDPVRDTTITERVLAIGFVALVGPAVAAWVLFRPGGRGRVLLEDALGLRQVRAQVSPLLMAHDELRRSRDELQVLRADLVRIDEATRRRWAQEIHDAPLQRLIHAMRLADQVEQPAIRRQLELAADELRDLAEALRPRALDDLGLAGALRWLADDMTERGRIPVTFTQTGQRAVADPFVEVALFRIAQEAVANAIKHSGANAITITWRGCGSRLLLKVRDNGKGFDPTAARSGHGLTGMRQRAAAAGLGFGIRSLDSGTVVWGCSCLVEPGVQQ